MCVPVPVCAAGVKAGAAQALSGGRTAVLTGEPQDRALLWRQAQAVSPRSPMVWLPLGL